MPRHVNQFSAGGRFPKGPLAGQSSTAYDCTVAVGIMALDDFTGGRIRPSATEFRARQDDNDKTGIGLDDVAKVWSSYGLTFGHGAKLWGSIMTRLRAGQPVAMQGWSGALGAYDVGRAVPHAIYATRASGSSITVHDPRRSGPIQIPGATVRRFYVSGLALAGWGTGGAARGATPGGAAMPTGLMGEWLTRIGRRETDPIRDQDVNPFVQFLQSKGLVPPGSPNNNPLVGAVVNIMRSLVGQPWTAAGRRFLAEAAATDPLGLNAAGNAIGAAIGEGAFVLIVGGTIAVLFLLGAWRLVAGDGRRRA